MTLVVKKILLSLVCILELIQELHGKRRGPVGMPWMTMSTRNSSLLSWFSTKTAPIAPKSGGITNFVSYIITSSSSLITFSAYAFIVPFSNPDAEYNFFFISKHCNINKTRVLILHITRKILATRKVLSCQHFNGGVYVRI